MNITTGKVPGAVKAVVYGPEGIGKTTFASRFPSPLFIDAEGGTKSLDVARFDRPGTWTDLCAQAAEAGKTDYRTLVIDTADWAEQMCVAHVVANSGNPKIKGIEGFGYGKGYVYVAEEFARLLSVCDSLVDAGKNVVFCAHAQIKKFEQPDEMGAYDRWELKLTRKTAPLLKEWCDMLLFANYKTDVVTRDDGKSKARGATRTLYAAHNAAWDAKNRSGLPAEMPFEYESIKPAVEGEEAPKTEAAPNPAQAAIPTPPAPATVSPSKPASIADAEAILDVKFEEVVPEFAGELRKLMKKEKITDAEIKAVIQKKVDAGAQYPVCSRIEEYPDDFARAVLIGAWPSVEKEVLDMRYKSEPIPF